LKPFAEGIEAKNGQEPAMKWAHLDIAGSMEVRAFSSNSTILWWFPFRGSVIDCHFYFCFLDELGDEAQPLPGKGHDWTSCSVRLSLMLFWSQCWD